MCRHEPVHQHHEGNERMGAEDDPWGGVRDGFYEFKVEFVDERTGIYCGDKCTENADLFP